MGGKVATPEDIAMIEELRTAVARMCREVIRPLTREVDEAAQHPAKGLEAVAEMGLFGIEIPEEYGGMGLGVRAHAMVCEELSWACPSTETAARTASLVSFPLTLFGTEAQKRQYLPAMAKGMLGCFGLTEPGGGSDVQNIKTRAERIDGGWRISGQKMFTSNAGVADLSIIFARTGGTGGKFASAFLVPTDRKGLTVGAKLKKMGRNGSVTAPLYLDNVEVSDDEMLGAEGDGIRVAFGTMVHGRAMQAAAGIGIARAVLEIALDYVKDRSAFGRTIGSFQAVQLKLAEIAMELEATRALSERVIRQIEAGEDANATSAMLKVNASRMALKACHDAMLCLGGYGYMREYLVEMFYRDVQLFEIAEGQNDVLLTAVIARSLGLPRQ